MMIHIKDALTGELIKSFEDSEVKPAIEAARNEGKIVNQELDDSKKDVLIFVYRGFDASRDIYTAETAAALERLGEQIKKAAQELKERVVPHITAALREAVEIFEAIETRPPETIKRELKHEKNPMRQKQLQKELNEAYKRRKGRSNSDGSI